MSRTHAHRKVPWEELSLWDRRYHYISSATRSAAKKKYWGGERRAVKQALLRGDEPAPTKTRHSVLWDLA